MAWQQMKEAFCLVADAAAPDIKVSVEYKPFQPRAFSLIQNMASTLLMIEDTKRDKPRCNFGFLSHAYGG